MLLSSRSRAGQRRSTSHFGENVSITLAEHMTNWNSSFAPYWRRFAFGVRIAIVDGFTASGMRHLSFHIGGTASRQEICRGTATLLLERYNRSDALWRSQKLAALRMNAPAYSQRSGLGPQPRSAYVCRISIIIRPKADGTNGCRRVTTLSGHRASRCNSRPGTQSPIYANLFFVWDQTGRLEDPRYVANAVHLFLNMLSYQSPQSCIQTLAPNASLRFETLPKERRLPFACYCFARAG